MNEEDDFEIKEPSEFFGKRDKGFSHSELIMMALRKCIEAGSKEMKAGFWNEKLDKFGNRIKTYIDDERKIFIESVETAKNQMICDFDDDATSKIKDIKVTLQTSLLTLKEQEEKYWKGLSARQKQEQNNKGIFQRDGYLNRGLPFYQDYLEEQVNIMRDILEELIKLTERKNFYKEEEYEA